MGSWVFDKHHVRGLAVYRAISGDLTVDKELGLRHRDEREECKWYWLLNGFPFVDTPSILYMPFLVLK